MDHGVWWIRSCSTLYSKYSTPYARMSSPSTDGRRTARSTPVLFPPGEWRSLVCRASDSPYVVIRINTFGQLIKDPWLFKIHGFSQRYPYLIWLFASEEATGLRSAKFRRIAALAAPRALPSRCWWNLNQPRRCLDTAPNDTVAC